jgi:hypothetical protein
VRKLLQIVTLIATAQPLAGQTARRSFVAAREPVPQMHDGIVHVLSGVMSPQRRELQTPPVQSRPTSVLILGGLAGGMVGGLLGGAVGAGLFGGIGEGACSYEEWVCRLHGFYWGAVVGESLGVLGRRAPRQQSSWRSPAFHPGIERTRRGGQHRDRGGWVRSARRTDRARRRPGGADYSVDSDRAASGALSADLDRIATLCAGVTNDVRGSASRTSP